MDSLPQDLLQLVLSSVPFPWVMQLRLVCRRWRSVSSSKAFAELWPSSSSRSLPWMLFHHARSTEYDDRSLISIFNPFSGKYLSLPLPSRPCSIAASYDGLLSCIFLSSPSSLLTIFNPLTRTSVALPPPNLICQISHLGIASVNAVQKGAHPRHKYIMVCGFVASGEDYKFELYHSGSKQWSILPKPRTAMLQRMADSRAGIQDITYWNCRFCMIWDGVVLTFNPHTSEWGHIELPTLPRLWNRRYVSLHSIKGQLYLEGNTQKQGDFQTRHPLEVGIVKMNVEMQGWSHVGHMPQEYMAKLGMGSYPVHTIYTASSDCDGDEIIFAHMQPLDKDDVFIFNVSTHMWSCVSIGNKRQGTFSCGWELKGKTFTPNLAALDL